MGFHDVKLIENEVVQFKGAAYPSATVHGDTLWVWRHLAHKIVARASAMHDPELLAESHRLQSMINHAFDEYNEICKKHQLGGFNQPDAETLDAAVKGRE
jgi:hypothetical protein